jgi:hypothetical protein
MPHARTSPTLSFSLTLLMCTPVMPAADLPSWAAINHAGPPVRVAIAPAPNDPYPHLSWPKALRTPAGTVLVSYSAGIGHNHGGSGIAVARSSDDGLTFSPPQLLMRFPEDDPRFRDCGNHALGLAPDGAVVLMAMAFDGNTANHLFGWRSVDDGHTWTRVDTSALGPNDAASVFGNFLNLPGRGLAVFGHYRPGSTRHTQGVWMALSPDDGRTWLPAERITDVHAVEPVVIQTQDRLIGFFRGDSQLKRGRQFIGVSDDLGRTWTTELSTLDAEHPGQARLAAPFAVENPERPGQLLVLTTERAVPGNTPGRIWLWRGCAADRVWQRERVLLEFPRVERDPHTDFGYPWLVHRGDRRWFMVYYHGNPRGYCPIWSAEVEL